MEVRNLMRISIALLILVAFSSCDYPKYYVEEKCVFGTETIVYETGLFGSAGILKATQHPPYSSYRNCTIIIKPPHDHGVVLSIREIDLRPKLRYFCRDYIKIFHSDIFESPTTICSFKMDFKEFTSYYSEGPMTIIYHTGPQDKDLDRYNTGFTFTYTAVTKDADQCKSEGKFLCDNGHCIDKEFTCDTRNNCGDRSDESVLQCESSVNNLGFPIIDIFFLTLVTIVIIFFLFTLVVVCIYRRNKVVDSDLVDDHPTTRLTPYQAVHPSGFFFCRNPAGPNADCEDGFSNPCFPTGVPQQPPPPYRR